MKEKILVGLLIFVLTAVTFACQRNGEAKNNMSEKIELPITIEKFVEAVNAAANDKFLAFFDKDNGVINDWGRKFVGHTAIKGWSDKEFIGAKGKMTPTKLEKKGEEYRVFADWKSNFYSGASLFIFTLDGEKIKEMRIESAK